MARVTVEDCIDKVENRFELVVLAAQRAKTIASGGALTIERKGEKDSVIALREIGEETIKVDDLRNHVVQSHQRPLSAFEEGALEDETPASDEEAALEASEVGAVIEEESEAAQVSEESLDDAPYSFEEENLDTDD